MSTGTLRRGQPVTIDTDLPYAGRSLRGRRGIVHRLGSNGSVYVCTCVSGGDFHAHTCPADLTLRQTEVVKAPRFDPRVQRGSVATASVLLFLIFGGLFFLAVLHLGQQAMCNAHDQGLRYCAGHPNNDPRETRP